MAMFSTLGLFGLLPRVPQKRKPGRPKKRPAHTLLTAPPKRPRGRPRAYDPDEIVPLVDEWKEAQRATGRKVSDAQAIAELLFEHAPREIRRKLQLHRDTAAESVSDARAIRTAVVRTVGSRFRTLTTLVARARAQHRTRK